MIYQKFLLLSLISLTFEFRRHSFTRKLQIETDIPSSEPEAIDSETTLPFVVPTHTPDTTVPVEPGPVGPGDQTTPQPSVPDSSNATATQTPETTNPNVFPIPGHENDPITTIPSVISQPTYDPINTESSTYFLVGVGRFILPPRHTPKPKARFNLYYKRITGRLIPPFHLIVFLKVNYRIFRVLQEGEGNTEEREERAECERITFDEDPNIKYNCSFDTDENAELAKVTMDLNKPPEFEGMSDAIAPKVIVSSLANETLSEKGIQNATGDDLLKTQYLMNNTVLEENGLRFKLIGEMDSYLPDKQITLSFDEKGNGKIKNATCDASYVQDNVFELDCLAEKGINAHLNGVSGVTTNTQEKVIIYMKPGTDEVLNAGSNYVGLYSRGSSSGLSGGAIAGIVIACVIALLTIAIGAMICRKPNTPAPFQESTLGVNISNTTD